MAYIVGGIFKGICAARDKLQTRLIIHCNPPALTCLQHTSFSVVQRIWGQIRYGTCCAWRRAAAGRHHDGVPYGRAGAGRRHSCRTPPLAHAIISLFDHHSCKKGSITSHSVPGGALPDTRNVVSHAYHVFFCMALALPSHARRVLPNTHDQRMRVW